MKKRNKGVTQFGVPFSSFKLKITAKRAEQEDRLSRLFNHKHRKRIIEVLKTYPDTFAFCELGELLDIPIGTLAYHLQLMEKQGIVYKVYWKQYVYYILSNVPNTKEWTELVFTVKGEIVKKRYYTESVDEKIEGKMNEKEETITISSSLV